MLSHNARASLRWHADLAAESMVTKWADADCYQFINSVDVLLSCCYCCYFAHNAFFVEGPAPSDCPQSKCTGL